VRDKEGLYSRYVVYTRSCSPWLRTKGRRSVEVFVMNNAPAAVCPRKRKVSNTLFWFSNEQMERRGDTCTRRREKLIANNSPNSCSLRWWHADRTPYGNP